MTPGSRAAGDLLTWAARRLGPVSESARLDAELLVGAILGLNRASVIAHPERELAAGQAERLAAAVERRAAGEPLAYIVGRREFYSLEIAVAPGVLVPRPETELLVDKALAMSLPPAARVLDLGTGSGAIALALKSARPDMQVVATDRSPAALAIAERNGAMLGIDVEWLGSDWFSALGGRCFELIVSNPPYVRRGELSAAGGLRHEPAAALDGGADGLDAFRAILESAGEYLAPGGRLLLEHGFDQRGALTGLARAHAFRVEETGDDLAGLPRVIVLARSGHG